MNLLILTDEAWNDSLYPNNVITNWFEGFPGQIANLYLASGTPDNSCCYRYFQITDKMAFKSRLRRKGAGKWFVSKSFSASPAVRTNRSCPSLKSPVLSAFKGPLRLLRDAVWLGSRWEDSLLMDFLADFRPDVIFSLRFSSRKVLYMERLLHSVTKAPVIPFTGDDEYSLRQLSASPFFWLRRLLVRRDIRRNASFYGKYYTLSERQAKELAEELGVKSKVLRKGGDFKELTAKKHVSKPIRIIYAGRLYCNRDKTLAALARALAAINKKEILITMEIYTKDKPGRRTATALNDGRTVSLKGFVSPEKLKEIYGEADIALHAESFDLKNRLLTRYSFSTKIIDCLASGCAVLAIGSPENEGIRYLRGTKSAVCIGKQKEIYPMLSHLVSHPDKIEVYRKKARKLGLKEHQREKVRKSLWKDLEAASKAGKPPEKKEKE